MRRSVQMCPRRRFEFFRARLEHVQMPGRDSNANYADRVRVAPAALSRVYGHNDLI